jgi:N-acetylmuramoyl-L-alanine amidase
MEMARRDTTPRSNRLANDLVVSLRDSIGRMHKRPRLSAGFSVLKAPDIPSVLIEVGFLSSQQDMKNLQTPEWRARAIMGIRKALQTWAVSDAAEAGLLRQ